MAYDIQLPLRKRILQLIRIDLQWLRVIVGSIQERARCLVLFLGPLLSNRMEYDSTRLGCAFRAPC